ncbi:hypothetical protein SmJEL517_g06227 [Synchytrium microbalum]|uniref:SUZ domain-containing protein n=1 Tax=Synchytrium microbalum TaxID=1806994 RepID=A0A507BJH8_9FUNG|nr:uncharacterized protein SmJEL517_g06227 [Synchytrium microbalum]TPX30147.1 hypothetical protein SmJEL517_g06227 [Synchytrium microbalum]
MEEEADEWEEAAPITLDKQIHETQLKTPSKPTPNNAANDDDWMSKGNESEHTEPSLVNTGQRIEVVAPQMKILKRNQNKAGDIPVMQRTGSGGVMKTLAEREAEYNAARARIFGGLDGADGGSTSNGVGNTNAEGGRNKSTTPATGEKIDLNDAANRNRPLPKSNGRGGGEGSPAMARMDPRSQSK